MCAQPVHPDLRRPDIAPQQSRQQQPQPLLMCVVLCYRVCLCAVQLAKTKAADIESLLQQLSDINHEMSGVIAGAGDARSHTLARHRDILTDLTQVGSQPASKPLDLYNRYQLTQDST